MNYIDGKMIRELREAKHLTQAELAALINVSDKTVSKWETGRGLPDIAVMGSLAEALQVSVAELFSGTTIKNRNVSGNMLKSRFYVCPVCGNVIHAVGEGSFSCHGISLPALEAEEGGMQVEIVEDEFFVTFHSPMKKDDYVSFAAYITPDFTQLVKLYPEQEPLARFTRHGHGKIFAYDIRNGLFCEKV